MIIIKYLEFRSFLDNKKDVDYLYYIQIIFLLIILLFCYFEINLNLEMFLKHPILLKIIIL